MRLATLSLIFLLFIMVKSCVCGYRPKGGRAAMANHQNKCKVLLARHEAAAAQNIAAQAAEAAPAPDPVPEEAPSAEDIRAPSPPPRVPSPPPLRRSGRPGRRIVLPKRYRDESPAAPPPVEIPEPPQNDPEPPPEPENTVRPRWFKTAPNSYGLYKVFPHPPTRDPDQSISLDDLCASSDLLVSQKNQPDATPTVPTAPWFPFLNATVARLMAWFHLGTNLKSLAELDALVEDVLLQDDFDVAHLRNFRAARENKRLDDTLASSIDESASAPDGWKTASVKIKLPAPKHCVAEKEAPEFEVPGLMYRPLLEVMIEAFQSPMFEEYHTTPFEYRWDPAYDPGDPDVQLEPADVTVDEHGLPELPAGHQVIYGEIYTSPRMLRAHNELPKAATTPHLETIIAAYMFWSDATHLANFGNASLWPLYTFFGNLSKYTRARPSANAGFHQAYFPSLPDSLKDFYREKFGVAVSADVWAHLKRELMHGIWDLLLCPEFIHAYVNGIVIKCYDGVERLVFPRFFTYGADYPEKVLLATIKYFGGCPCPRCFVEKEQISQMGTAADMRRRQKIREDNAWYRRTIDTARRWIFEKGYLVAGAAINRILKPTSLVPTRNAFSKLAQYGFNFFSMFVPDFLHEVELGGWKSLFLHLIRVLHAYNPVSVEKLNERFRKIPTFGRSTIRRFHTNVSDMKKPAARDFEDILQCCIPAFEGLLPEPHNAIILTLLYTFATWHAYGKLRLHTSGTISAWRTVTTELGAQARGFLNTTCEAYTTYELPQEQNRRARRQAKKNSKSTGNPTPAATSKARKTWNINTYKWHSFGDYPDAVVDVGTIESYSTVLGELAHCAAKRAYAKTNKRNFEQQIAAHERRKRLLRRIKLRMNPKTLKKKPTTPPQPEQQPKEQRTKNAEKLAPTHDTLPRTPPRQRYHISESKRTWLHALDLPDDFPDDPALLARNFNDDLKSHLLSRLLGIPYSGDETEYSDQDLADVNIVRDRLYTHKILRVNYTTYDLRRDQDTINTRTHPDIMVLAHEDEDDSRAHPYWYARIVGIFHAEVRHVGPRSKNTAKLHRMDFLWVRWFGRDTTHSAGWLAKRLHRVGFIPASEPDLSVFGFLDPAEIVRAVHLIPAFHYGRTTELLGPSIARHFDDENQEDYEYYYVNQFVDRDMLMRFIGNGVGHRNIAASLEEDPASGTIELGGEDDEMDVDPPLSADNSLFEREPEGSDEEGSVEEGSFSSGDSSAEEEEEEEEEEEKEEEENGAEPTDDDFLDNAGIAGF
ncbi:GLOBIN domain-containing protein [Favolaschia claudopus]|uniref:GLOBIN domain-containing protein n=1 Tax=Favolaschia claudopus TaxID=2862362 RepID=A0AAW0CWD6_9AGAR